MPQDVQVLPVNEVYAHCNLHTSHSGPASAAMGEIVDSELKSHQPNLKYLKSACLAAAFFVIGLCVAILGPAFPTLAYNLGEDSKSVSFIFTARGCGYLFGSILSAILFKKMNPYLLLTFCLLLTSIGNFSVPFVPNAPLLAAVLTTTGCSMGVLDTGGNVLCLHLWGTESEPWMQTLHFFFALGATVAPLVAQPFINEVIPAKKEWTHNSTNATSAVQDHQSFASLIPTDSTSGMPGAFPQVAWSFIIAACLSLGVAVAFCFLSFSKVQKSQSRQQNTIKQEGRKFRFQILALLFMFYLVYVGTEVTFGLFIYSFAINCQGHYSKNTGTMLNSVFWASFAAGRFCAIFFTMCIKPKTLLSLDMLGTLVSTIAMSMFPIYFDSAEWILWISVGLYGWSMASLFPSGISWAEHYITVTGKAASIFVVGAALGEMAVPFMMGFIMDQNPMNLMYFCLSSTILCILIFIMLLKISRAKGSRLKLPREKESTDCGEVQCVKAPEEYSLLPGVHSATTSELL